MKSNKWHAVGQCWTGEFWDQCNCSRSKYDYAYFISVPSFLLQKYFLDNAIILLFSSRRQSGFLNSHITAWFIIIFYMTSFDMDIGEQKLHKRIKIHSIIIMWIPVIFSYKMILPAFSYQLIGFPSLVVKF